MRTFSQIRYLDHHFDADPVLFPSYTISILNLPTESLKRLGKWTDKRTRANPSQEFLVFSCYYYLLDWPRDLNCGRQGEDRSPRP